MFFFSQRSYMETKGWDVFRVLPPETDSSSEQLQKWLIHAVKILKVLAYLFTFCMVLVCGVVTKVKCKSNFSLFLPVIGLLPPIQSSQLLKKSLLTQKGNILVSWLVSHWCYWLTFNESVVINADLLIVA